MLRILIADDHGLLRAGLRSLLGAEPEIVVVGEAADGHQALLLAHELEPDVVLADISMPGPSGIDIARELKRRSSRTRVLITTMHEDAGLLHEAIEAGAAGYLIKRAAETDLIRAIETVARGELYIHDGVKAAAAPRRADQPAAASDSIIELNTEETEVLRLIARGRTSFQIANELGIDLRAIERNRASLCDKLNVRNRVGLIEHARRRGLI